MLKSKLLTYKELSNYIKEKYKTYNSITTFLSKNDFIEKITIGHKLRNIPGKLYWDKKKNKGSLTVYDIALSLHNRSYITGYKLLSLLGWTEYLPKIIHVNWIRGPIKSLRDDVDNAKVQELAFKSKVKSSTKLSYENYDIIYLNGQYLPEDCDHHFMSSNSIPLLPRYSRIFVPERLIIECLVNYHYFGGADLVWSIGLERLNDLNHHKLLQIYNDMDYIYPYANAIGYWLEYTGIKKEVIKKWEMRINSKIQFHLFMGDKERRVFIEKWNLYIPKRFS